jgi:hypothetical protein
MSKRKRPSKRVSSESESNNDEYIYLIQPREFVRLNEPTFKVGRTSRGPYARSKEYTKDSVVWLMHKVSNSTPIETDILTKFKNKYQQMLNYGNEYFKGDNQNMIDDIREIIRSYDENKNKFDGKVYLEAAKNGDLETFEKQDKLRNNKLLNSKVMEYTIQHNQYNIVTYIINNYECELKDITKILSMQCLPQFWNDILHTLYRKEYMHGQKERECLKLIIESIIDKGANDWNSVLKLSIKYRYDDIADYSMRHGANLITCAYDEIEHMFTISNPIYDDINTYIKDTPIEALKREIMECMCGYCGDELWCQQTEGDPMPRYTYESNYDRYKSKYSTVLKTCVYNIYKIIDYGIEHGLDLNKCVLRCIDMYKSHNELAYSLIKYLIEKPYDFSIFKLLFGESTTRICGFLCAYLLLHALLNKKPKHYALTVFVRGE